MLFVLFFCTSRVRLQHFVGKSGCAHGNMRAILTCESLKLSGKKRNGAHGMCISGHVTLDRSIDRCQFCQCCNHLGKQSDPLLIDYPKLADQDCPSSSVFYPWMVMDHVLPYMHEGMYLLRDVCKSSSRLQACETMYALMSLIPTRSCLQKSSTYLLTYPHITIKLRVFHCTNVLKAKLTASTCKKSILHVHFARKAHMQE
jgi:hypothetical protein